MKIGVVGAGGLGGYFGGRLALDGNEIHFLARGGHLAGMREGGLRVRSVRGDFVLPPTAFHATDDSGAIGPCEVVLFTVKAFDTDTAATAIDTMLLPETPVISLQNGIDNEDRIATRIGVEHVVGGVAYIFAGIESPGVIRDKGGPARMVFGELHGNHGDRLERFLETSLRAGIDSVLAPDIRVVLWSKFAFICAQAGMTATTRLPIGDIRTSKPAWAMFRQIVEEVRRLGIAHGVRLPETLVDDQLAFALSLPPESYSSLYDDMIGGRRMELEALLGEIVRRGDTLAVQVPASRAVYSVLEPWARRAEDSDAVRA